ncbi:hypothetical protein LCGC14_2305020 [marine sediment metagenome]|uniref:Uncharacterized protein n=1 Tax=marine sediment metagenome TaxID=412755 RepID=A0A0F9EZR6_9ZZZZ
MKKIKIVLWGMATLTGVVILIGSYSITDKLLGMPVLLLGTGVLCIYTDWLASKEEHNVDK